MTDASTMTGSAGSANPVDPPAVDVRGLTKAFGRDRVLDGLDFAPPAGAVVGLLGGNGAGKSTLLKILVGLLRKDGGAATIGGHDVWDLPAETKARIGYVDQRPAFYPWMTGRDLLPYLGGFYPSWDRELVQRLADEWEVPLGKPFGKLSPGQQQRVALLAALGHRPDLLILDEPVSALDPAARRAFLRSLLERVAEDGPTVVLSTHITSDIERVASHVAVMAGGRVCCFAELDELKEGVKRLRVRGGGEGDAPPPSAAAIRELAGPVWSCVAEGGGVSAVTRSDPTAAAERLRAAGFVVDTDDLNLEEAYLAITSGGAA